MNTPSIRVLALDLEGTLISNAVSIFTRPHLFSFLEFCHAHFERVVLFTAVSEHRVRYIIHLLADEGTVPQWFRDIECVRWKGPYKNLKFVDGAALEEVLLIDDQEHYIHPEQKTQWIPIQEYIRPYSDEDTALIELREQLCNRLTDSGQR